MSWKWWESDSAWPFTVQQSSSFYGFGQGEMQSVCASGEYQEFVQLCPFHHGEWGGQWHSVLLHLRRTGAGIPSRRKDHGIVLVQELFGRHLPSQVSDCNIVISTHLSKLKARVKEEDNINKNKLQPCDRRGLCRTKWIRGLFGFTTEQSSILLTPSHRKIQSKIH